MYLRIHASFHPGLISGLEQNVELVLLPECPKQRSCRANITIVNDAIKRVYIKQKQCT